MSGDSLPRAANGMTDLLNVLAPLFCLMALGFGAVRGGLIEERGVRGLVLFVFNFSIPSLLLRSLAQMEFPADIEWGFLGAFYAGSIVTYVAGIAIGRFPFKRSLADQAIFGMGGAFSNLVFMGIPITLSALGPDASLPMLLIIGFHSATFMPLTLAIVQADGPNRKRGFARFFAVFRDVARNPIILGILAGVIVNLLGFTLWVPVDRVLDLLGSAAVPVALFAMGASLAGYPLAGDVLPALVLSVLKLVVHPLVVWLVAVPWLGLGGLWVSVAIIMAAMPSAVNVYLFGARYDAAPDVAARTVLISTVGSVVTISVILAMMGG